MVGIGAAELLVLAAIALGGGSLSTLGVPLPPDAGLHSAAPPECLAFAAHYGSKRPDPTSTNGLEQLLAEPEIAGLAEELLRLGHEALKKAPAGDESSRLAAETLPTIIATLLSRPNILYLASVKTPPAAPSANAGFVLHAGEKAAELQAAVESWERFYLSKVPPTMSVTKSRVGSTEVRRLPLPPGSPPVAWSMSGEYLIVAVGEGEAEAIVRRLEERGPAPDWLHKLTGELAIPRLGGLLYVDAARAWKTARPLVEQLAIGNKPDVVTLLDNLGLADLRYLALATGLNETHSVAKLVVGHNPQAGGLLKLLDAKPLTKDDLAAIPRSADFALAGRFDLNTNWKHVLDTLRKTDASMIDWFEYGLNAAGQQAGFDIQKDLIASLGDSWVVYNSPTEGGSLLTGLCAVLAVRDRAKIEGVIEKVERLATAAATRGGNRPAPFAVRSTTVGDKTISYVQVLEAPVPVAPAWCLTDDRLVIALAPQMVRSHLTRSAKAETLADNPAVARHLAAGDVTSLSYVDTNLMNQVIYSYLQYGATMGASALEKEIGIRADLAKFPSFSTVSRFLQPAIGVTRRTETTWSSESHTVGPALGPAVVPVAGMAMALILPQIQSAREAARQNTSRNNLRALGFAMFSFANRNGRYPDRATSSPDGKRLLSWRVQILPDIDRQALYDEFHHDEPWDSPHNRKLVAKMPPLFMHPSHPELLAQGKTLYQLPTGSGTAYEKDRGPTDESIRTPKDKTALIVEASLANAVEWTRPDDVQLDPDDPLANLLHSPQGGPNIVFYGQNVTALRSYEFDAATLKAMFFPNAAR